MTAGARDPSRHRRMRRRHYVRGRVVRQSSSGDCKRKPVNANRIASASKYETKRFDLILFNFQISTKAFANGRWHCHSETFVEMRARFFILDAHWSFLRQPVLPAELQRGPFGFVGAGGELVF